MIVTIDGPAGAGKSSVARLLAQRLGFEFLDTGAMYRAVTLAARRARLDLTDQTALAQLVAGLTLEMSPMPERNGGLLRVGFTASRKIGGAVERNRAKRRLRAAAQAVLPLYGLAGNDYVLVARRETLTRPFDGLIGDLQSALAAAHARLPSQPGDIR